MRETQRKYVVPAGHNAECRLLGGFAQQAGKCCARGVFGLGGLFFGMPHTRQELLQATVILRILLCEMRYGPP